MKILKDPNFDDIFFSSVFELLKWFRQFGIFPLALSLIAIALIVVLRLTAGTGTKSASLPKMYNSVGIAVAHSPFDAKYLRAAVPASGAQWSSIVRQAQRIENPQQRIAFIHTFVISYIQYAEDIDVYGTRDYWATPAETLARRRGDCEDFAILELMLLKGSGIPATDIYFTVGADLIARRDHALLSVLIGNSMWALDQRAPSPFLTTSMTDFRPILTLQGRQVWLHGFTIKSSG
jgi:predicted transglutaminase-like cysteine proteinase